MRLVLEMVDMGAVTGWCEMQTHRPVPLCETGHPPLPPLYSPDPRLQYVGPEKPVRISRAGYDVFPETPSGAELVSPRMGNGGHGCARAVNRGCPAEALCVV